jgi:hypothetical protein
MKPSYSERFHQHWFAAHSRIALFDLMQEAVKHRRCIESAVIAKTVFVQVGLQVPFANRVINTAHTILHQAPKALYRVRMNVADNVDLGAVIDSLMRVAHCRHVLDR